MRKPSIGGSLPAVGLPVIVATRVTDPFNHADVFPGTKGYVYGHEPGTGEVRIKITEAPHCDYWFFARPGDYNLLTPTTAPS